MRKQNLILSGLLFLIIMLTVFAVGREPQKPILGILAPFILPILLTAYFLIVLAYGKVIMEILAAFFVTKPKQGGRHGNLLATVVGWMIIMGVVVFLFRSGIAQRIISLMQESAANLTSAALRSFQLSQSNASIASPTNIMLYYYTAIIFGSIVVLSFSLFFGGLHRAFKSARRDAGRLSKDATKDDALQVVRQAVAALKSNNEYGEVIIRCYKEMCTVLSNQGMPISSNETAREFARNTSRRLRLGSEAVRSLTFLFEEARYSHHKIDDAKRTQALDQLSSLENSLAQTGSTNL